VGQDLRGRLRRIKEIRKGAAAPEAPGKISRQSAAGIAIRPDASAPGPPLPFSPSSGPEWSSAGPLSAKRTVWHEPPAALSAGLPGALDILIPDFFLYGREPGRPEMEDLVFFDLETTGLSGGPGTVAFLAAFGRFVRDGGAAALRLRVTQYLLLDYPGEGDFLAAALAELGRPAPSGRPPLVVTYNGKSFDSQILKIRCLMNGLKPPVYYQADLLHPCRRLWKRVLPACSQGDLETAVLGLDRTGDIPGALAPDIWFSFLKTGGTAELLNICDHNVRDITGLAALFAALSRIAEDPAAAPETYRVDLESLALRWFDVLKDRRPGTRPDRRPSEREQRLARELLILAADRACPRAAYVWARELIRRGNAEEGIERLSRITGGEAPEGLKAAAYRALAVDAEWRLGDSRLALEYVDLFLLVPENIHSGVYGDMQKRRERLIKKRKAKEAVKNGKHGEYPGDGDRRLR
jgi:uncharacterized protein YprB with RNaseH-like and TPR domain